ncbi:MAG: hypothetical protein RBQ71_00205 [Acholeplasmataceae bacterium]|jgi:uncharacterized membrane protein|nr:hypothetical protein [Acholeplasmataceae bacterium]
MRNTVRLFLLVLTFGLLFVITGCKDEPTPIPTPTPEITDFNVLGNWTDGGDAAYTFLTNTATELDFTYDKATFPYAFIQSALITEDLSVYKKLVITVEGTGSMLLKLETNDDTPAKEVGLNVTGIAGTYEWNLMAAADFLAKVDRVVIIAAPGKEASVGAITVTQLLFQDEVADGYIINDNFNNIPSNVNEYNGTDVEFNFNAKWESNDEGIYEITYDGTDAVVDYDKGAGLEWAFMRTRVQGDFTDFNYAVFIVTGTAGQKLLIKPNEYNAVEAFIWLDGTEQELVIDLTELTLEQKNAITDFKVFIAAGLAPAAGQLTIHEAYMVDEYDFVVPVFDVNEYNGTDSEFGVQYWYDGGDLVYDIALVGTDYEVDYEKLTSNLHYAFMYALLDGDYTSFSKIEFEMTGQTGKKILLKIESENGNKELEFTFDGTKQLFTIDLTTMTTAQLETLNKVVMFAAPGGTGAGEFTVHSVTFKNSDYLVDTDWVSNDPGVYTIVDGVVTYNKVAGQEYSAFINTFDSAAVAGLNTMTVVIKGTAGKSVILKPNDLGTLETTVAFTDANPVTKVFTADAWTKLVIMAEGGTAPATGSFEIVSITLSYVKPEADFDPTLEVEIDEADWVSLDAGVYTITDGVVTYTKGVGQEYSAFINTFDAEAVAGLNTMTVVVKGTAGKSLIIKPNDLGSLEKNYTFVDANPVTFVFRADAWTKLVLMAEGGTPSVTGTFEIVSVTLSYSVLVDEADWVSLDAGVYAITDGVVTYTKGVGQEYSAFINAFDAEEVAGLNTMTIVIKGTAGKSLILKPNDLGSLEQTVTFTDANPVTKVFTADAWTKLVIMAEGGTASVTGTFEIVSITLSYNEPEFDPTLEVEVDETAWVSLDAGVYAITDGVVTYTKGVGQEYSAFINTFDTEEVAGLNTMTVVVKGTAGKSLIIKPNDLGSLEKNYTFVDANPVTFVFRADAWTKLVLMAEGGTPSVTGTFEIVSVTLSYSVLVDEADWVSLDAGVYAITDGVVTYTKGVGQEYSAFINTFDAEAVAGLNTMTIVIKGTAGKSLILKPNDLGSLEQTVTFTDAEPVTVTVTADAFSKMVIMAEGGTPSVSGTFEIVSIVLSYVAPVVG